MPCPVLYNTKSCKRLDQKAWYHKVQCMCTVRLKYSQLQEQILRKVQYGGEDTVKANVVIQTKKQTNNKIKLNTSYVHTSHKYILEFKGNFKLKKETN